MCGGPRVILNAFPTFQGSIPACAGEPGPSAVYPRVCGGTADRLTDQVNNRSIPACAGEPVSLGWVYPRVCGGTGGIVLVVERCQVARRSIPACAGAELAGVDPPSCNRGSIPACAGEPSTRPRVRGNLGHRGEVYPRVCGGTARPREGLSPRVRGNLLLM